MGTKLLPASDPPGCPGPVCLEARTLGKGSKPRGVLPSPAPEPGDGPAPSTLSRPSAALTLGGAPTALAELEALVRPADGVADVAGVYVPAVGIDLLLQSEGAPGRRDPLAPSVPGVGHITTSGGRAVQGHSALSTAQGRRLLQQLQLGLPHGAWKQRF